MSASSDKGLFNYHLTEIPSKQLCRFLNEIWAGLENKAQPGQNYITKAHSDIAALHVKAYGAIIDSLVAFLKGEFNFEVDENEIRQIAGLLDDNHKAVMLHNENHLNTLSMGGLAASNNAGATIRYYVNYCRRNAELERIHNATTTFFTQVPNSNSNSADSSHTIVEIPDDEIRPDETTPLNPTAQNKLLKLNG